AALQKLQHDCWGNRCARRCTEQTSDATFWVVDQGGAKFQGTETRSSSRLDNLYALTSYNGLPICAISAWHVLAECFNAVIQILDDFLYQVLGEPELLRSDAQVRRDIIWTNGLKQVQVRTLLEELRAPATVRAKEQALLTIDNASIQVRNRHWWCAHRSFAVNLSVVLFYQVLVGRAEP